MFVIDVIFISQKHWTSFDVGERRSVDDDEAKMKTAAMVAIFY